ncbi:MAG: hypothetical protein V4694_01755 [Pseudomonadota bacterium]
MSTEKTLEKAMLNRKPISFQYNKIGKVQTIKVENARVILISTTRLGKKTIMIDESDMSKSSPSWKYFDMEEMRNVQIVNDDCAFVAAQELSLIDGFAMESFAI